MNTLVHPLTVLRQTISRACLTAKREEASVTFVAVSKGHSAKTIKTALDAGQRVFGENKVQEATIKFSALRPLYPDLKLHMIGRLQTNKVRQAVALFDTIETLDRPALAEAIAKACTALERRPRLLLQINIGQEPQKGGVRPENAPALLTYCRTLGLEIEGLMGLPPLGQDPAPFFAQMKALADQLGLKSLSMGMSGDFEIAIRHGATSVRLGTAFFGERSLPKAVSAL